CNLHLMRQINAAKRKGARLVVIDPRRVKVAEQAQLHLPVRPGTDVVLAWAIAVELERLGGLDRAFIDEHVLGFDAFMDAARGYPPERAAQICGVELEDIRTLARWYKEASPAVIAWGNGLERNQNGGSGLRAIAALPALAGKFGVAGGGLVGGAGHAFPKTLDKLTPAGLYPAYGQQYLQRAEAVIAPVGESLPNTEIFRRLAARFGLTDPAFRVSDAELMDAALSSDDPRMQGLKPSRIPVDRAIKMEYGSAEPVLFDNVAPRT